MEECLLLPLINIESLIQEAKMQGQVFLHALLETKNIKLKIC